jgi:hypothetical protein
MLASRRLDQAITFWIVTSPLNNCSKCRFDIGSLGSLRLCAQ